MSCPLATERVWTDKARYNEAEKNYFEQLSKLLKVDSDKIIGDDVGEESYAYPPPAKAGRNNHKKKVANDKEATNVASNEVKEAPVAKHKKEKNKKNKQINNDSAVNKDGEEKIDQEKDVVVKIKEVKKEGSLEKTTDEIIKVDEVKPKKPKKKKKNNNKEETSPDNLKPESVKKQDSNNIKNPTKAANNEPVPQVEKPKPEKIKVHGGGQQCTLVSEIAKARQHIKNSLERMDGIAALAATPGTDVADKVNHLQKETDKLTKTMNQLQKYMAKMETRMNQLEEQVKKSSSVDTQTSSSAVTSKPKTEEKKKKNEAEDDDGVDLFASDSEEEDASAAKIREQRLAEYNAKKSKKPALIAKSNVILDVKPWDDETDLTQMEEVIRKIECDGLLWGASKFVPVAFGIKKLSISCVVEDEKVSIDWLTEEIEKHEDYVQSVDVAAFNKI